MVTVVVVKENEAQGLLVHAGKHLLVLKSCGRWRARCEDRPLSIADYAACWNRAGTMKRASRWRILREKWPVETRQGGLKVMPLFSLLDPTQSFQNGTVYFSYDGNLMPDRDGLNERELRHRLRCQIGFGGEWPHDVAPHRICLVIHLAALRATFAAGKARSEGERNRTIIKRHPKAACIFPHSAEGSVVMAEKWRFHWSSVWHCAPLRNYETSGMENSCVGFGFSRHRRRARYLAYAEALERYCCQVPPEPSSPVQVSIGSRSFLLPVPSQEQMLRLYWPACQPGGRSGNSSGSAFHRRIDSAFANGLLELIERDAAMVSWLWKAPKFRIPEEEWPVVVRMIARSLASHGWSFTVYDITSDLEVPVALAAFRRTHEETEHSLATAAAWTFEQATVKAMLEALALVVMRRQLEGERATAIEVGAVRDPADHWRFHSDSRKNELADFFSDHAPPGFRRKQPRPAEESLCALCDRGVVAMLERPLPVVWRGAGRVVSVASDSLQPIMFGSNPVEPVVLSRPEEMRRYWKTLRWEPPQSVSASQRIHPFV